MKNKPFKVAFVLTVLVSLSLIASVFYVSSVFATPLPKVWVCKYVTTPDGGEILREANNPTLMSGNALKDWNGETLPYPFADAQGPSVAIALEGTEPEPTIDDCPAPFVPPDPESQTIYYVDDCVGVNSQYQERYWEDGRFGSFGDWVDVGDPVLVHPWTDPYTTEFWIAPDGVKYFEPEHCFIPYDDEDQTIYYVDGCVGVNSQYQERYWVDGEGGSFGPWTNVGDPVLVHPWTDPYTTEFWIAPDQVEYFEPEHCFIPYDDEDQTIYYVDGCVGVNSQYQERYWVDGEGGSFGPWTNVGDPVLVHPWTDPYTTEFWIAPDQVEYFEPEHCFIPYDDEDQTIYYVDGCVGVNSQYQERYWVDGEGGSFGPWTNVGDPVLVHPWTDPYTTEFWIAPDQVEYFEPEHCFIPYDDEDQTIYYVDGCVGVNSQYQERYWVDGEGGSFGPWTNVGDPVLVHPWTDPYTTEFWIAPDQVEYFEPEHCFIPYDDEDQTIYYVDGCVGVNSQYQERYWVDGEGGSFGPWTNVGDPVLVHPWTDPYTTEFWIAPDQVEYFEPEHCFIPYDDEDQTIYYVDGCVGVNSQYQERYWVDGEGGSFGPWTNVGDPVLVHPWTDPYTTEFWIAPDGVKYFEPEYCLRHETTVVIIELVCDPKTGLTKFAVIMGNGFESLQIGDDIVLTKSGFVFLDKGSYDWFAVLKEGYDPVGPIDGTLDVAGCKRTLACPTCGPHIDETHMRNGLSGMAMSWFGTTECVIDWANWCVDWDVGLRTWATKPNYFVRQDTEERVDSEIRDAVNGQTCYITNQTLEPFAPWIIYGEEGERFRNYETGEGMVNKYSSCSVDVTICDTDNGQGIVAGGQAVSDWADFLVLEGSCYPNTPAGYTEAYEYLASIGLEYEEIPFGMIGVRFDLPSTCDWTQ